MGFKLARPQAVVNAESWYSARALAGLRRGYAGESQVRAAYAMHSDKAAL